jgi:hypothetical protein
VPADDAVGCGREVERPLDERLRVLGVELQQVALGQRLRHERLEVLPLELLRDGDRPLRVVAERGAVAGPGGDVRPRPERVEERHVALLGEQAHRLLDQLERAGGVRAEVERHLGEARERTALEARLSRLRGRCPDGLHLHGHGAEVGEPPGRTGGEVAALERRRQLHRPEQQLPAAAERLAREAAPAGVGEGERRLLGELLRRRTVELPQQPRRLVEMEGADLEQLGAGPLGEPARVAVVQVGARALREAGVGDLADQHVLELERLLAADRRPLLAHDEVAEEEAVEALRDVVDVRREVLERAAHEQPPHRGGALEQPALHDGQTVDPGCDQRLQRVGDPLRPAALPLREHADRLLHEERVALGLGEHGVGVDRDADLRGEGEDELGALLRRQRLELERHRAHAAAAPGRADVEQLGPGEAEQQQRRLAHPGREVLDQLEQRLLAPVHVLEDEHERLRPRELLAPRAHRPGDLLLGALALDRLEHADGEPEQVGDRLVLAARAQLVLRAVERVVVGDARRRLHHLGDRPVGDALAVREAAPLEHRGALDALDELAREAALAHAGVAVERDEGGPAVAGGAGEGRLEQVELRLAADERRLERLDRLARLDRADDAARGDGLPPAAQLEGRHGLELDAATDEPGRGRADEDLVRGGLLLQARGQVDGLAGREGGVAVVGDDLAGLDPHSRLEPELPHALERHEARADRALGVVLVRERDAERRHHGVPGELLDGAAVGDDAVRDLVEEAVDPPADDLRVGVGDELGRGDEVDEQDGCELPLHDAMVDPAQVATRRRAARFP